MAASSLDCQCPPDVQLISSQVQEYEIALHTPGVYFFTTDVTGSLGGTYSDTTAVAAVDFEEMDARLKAVLTGMKQALSSGDIETALSYHLADRRAGYEEIYSALSGQLPAIAQEMQSISAVQIFDNLAKYRIERIRNINGQDHTITYYIYFRRDENG